MSAVRAAPLNERMRVCLVIIDGIADTGTCTPLQEVTHPPPPPHPMLEVNAAPAFSLSAFLQAHTPCMDAIARAGANGLMDPVEPVRRALSLL
jgi:2,3-bisphosphoglycerate-independent phosphoglycerate mutase